MIWEVNNKNINNQNLDNMMGQSNFNRNIPGNSFGGKKPEDLIPRSKKNESVDFYKNEQFKLNIIMTASSGLIISLPTPPYVTISQLLKNYVKKIGLGEHVLKKDLTFLFNAELIKYNDNRPISAIFQDNMNVTVVDAKGIIGA